MAFLLKDNRYIIEALAALRQLAETSQGAFRIAVAIAGGGTQLALSDRIANANIHGRNIPLLTQSLNANRSQ